VTSTDTEFAVKREGLSELEALVYDLHDAIAKGEQVLRRYGARIGEFRFLLPAGVPAELLPTQSTARLPLSPPELLGVINVRGALAPLFDLARLKQDGLEDVPLMHDASETPMVVMIGVGNNAFAIVIDGFLRTLVDPVAVDSDGLKAPVPASLVSSVGAPWRADESVWFEFDMAAFLEHRAKNATVPEELHTRVI
jgi:chemotaxis signal transduction protein